MTYLWIALGIFLWLVLGYIGSYLTKRWWLSASPPLDWNSECEMMARILIFLGPINTLVGVFQWLRETKVTSSWWR